MSPSSSSLSSPCPPTLVKVVVRSRTAYGLYSDEEATFDLAGGGCGHHGPPMQHPMITLHATLTETLPIVVQPVNRYRGGGGGGGGVEEKELRVLTRGCGAGRVLCLKAERPPSPCPSPPPRPMENDEISV